MSANLLSGRPTKLRTGAWGVVVQGCAQAGDLVTIEAKSGKRWQAIVRRVYWTAEDGTATICYAENLPRESES